MRAILRLRLTTPHRNLAQAPFIITAMPDRLALLWKSRERLSTQEWEELFGLVSGVLSRARLLQGHALSRQELVHDFFVDKLLFGRSDAAPFNEATLLFYFKRYQYDRLPPPDSADASAAEVGGHGCLADDTLFLNKREPRIHAFFDALTDEEKLLVALVQCEDHSVLEVEQQHAIRSGAYRARQLGIVLSKNAMPASWRDTKLGRTVMGDMGIAISDHHKPDLLQVFRLLCAKAGDWWRQR